MTYWLSLGLNVFPVDVMEIQRIHSGGNQIKVQLRSFPDIDPIWVPSHYVTDEAGKQLL